ncbi:hypothetical protein H0H93_014590, partial [Arthromyces matolae]
KYTARKSRKYLSQSNRLLLPLLEWTYILGAIGYAPRSVVGGVGEKGMLGEVLKALRELLEYVNEGDGVDDDVESGSEEYSGLPEEEPKSPNANGPRKPKETKKPLTVEVNVPSVTPTRQESRTPQTSKSLTTPRSPNSSRTPLKSPKTSHTPKTPLTSHSGKSFLSLFSPRTPITPVSPLLNMKGRHSADAEKEKTGKRKRKTPSDYGVHGEKEFYDDLCLARFLEGDPDAVLESSNLSIPPNSPRNPTDAGEADVEREDKVETEPRNVDSDSNADENKTASSSYDSHSPSDKNISHQTQTKLSAGAE